MPALIGPDGRHFKLKDGVIVGRVTNDGGEQPDIDLGVVERGQTISRRHARIMRRNGSWYVRVQNRVTNATKVAGKKLEAGQEARLSDGDEVELGAVPLIFLADWDAEATVVGNMQAAAEIRVDGRTFPLVGLEGRKLRIGRRSTDGTYRPDVDLRDVPGSSTVSHLHGHLYRRGDEWLWHAVKTTNGTLIGGREVTPGDDIPLTDGETLRLGRLRITFHQRTIARVVGNELLALTVMPEEVTMEAGSVQQSRINIVNLTGRVEQVTVELEGIPEEWYTLAATEGASGKKLDLQLLNAVEPNQPLAGSFAQIIVTFQPPRVPESRAGLYPISVSATTKGEDQVRRVATSRLRVLPFEGLELAVGPEEVKGSRGTYWAEVKNTGNMEINAELEVATHTKNVKADTPKQSFRVANGASNRVELPIRARRHWLGFDQTYGIDITVLAAGQRRAGSVRMQVAPRLPRWVQFLIGKVYTMASPVALPVVSVAILIGVGYFLLRPPEVKSFRAEALAVVAGTSTNLVWSLDRAASVAIEPNTGEQLLVPEGTLAVSPTALTEYTLTARNFFGISSSAKVTVDVMEIVEFKATPDRINREGQDVVLAWKTVGAQRVKIEPESPDIRDPKPNGEGKVRPAASTNYMLTATGAGGITTTREVTVTIGPPSIARFDMIPTPRNSVYQGDPVQLTWAADGFTSLSISVDKGEVAPGRQQLDVSGGPPGIVYPTRPGDVTYTLTAANAAGTTQRMLTVPVSPVTIAQFDADPPTVPAGQPARLRWRVEGANSATRIVLEPGLGTVADVGELTVTPNTDTTYILRVTAADGSVQERDKQVAVELLPAINVFTAARSAITLGEEARLTWSVSNAEEIEIRSADGLFRVTRRQPEGFVNDLPAEATTYILEARSAAGRSVKKDVTVDVRLPGQPTPAPEPPPPAPAPAPAPPPP